MIQELFQQVVEIWFQYYLGIIIFLLIPFYGIYHKFDRDFFIDGMKDLWHNNKATTGWFGYIVAFPVIFMLYGYKTAWDRFRWSFPMD